MDTKQDVYWQWIIVTMPDGKWRIPASVVARSRSVYYAKLDADSGDAENYEAAYKAEYEYAMTDEFELIDWASNNMLWKEVAGVAVRVPHTNPAPDYAREWTNAKKALQQ